MVTVFKKMSAFYMIVALTATMFLSSCGGKDDETPKEDAYLNVSEASVSFESTGGIRVITVETNTQDWTFGVTGGAGWLASEKTSTGTGVKLTASESNSLEARMATLTVSSVAAGATRTVQVSQAGLVLSFSVEDGLKTIGVAGGELTFTVTSNITDWTVSSDQSWLTASKSGAGIQVVASKNNTPAPRTAEVSFTVLGEVVHRLQITQVDYFPVYFTSGDLAVDHGDYYHLFMEGEPNGDNISQLMFLDATSADLEYGKKYHFRFEYQMVKPVNPLHIAPSTSLGYWDGIVGWFGFYNPLEATGSLDPNDANKWKQAAWDMREATDAGWRTGTFIMNFYNCPNEGLIRNLKIVMVE